MSNECSTNSSPAPGCDLCGTTRAREIYTAADRLGNSSTVFSIAVCEGCGVLRTLPDIDECDLGDFYPKDYWGAETEPSDDWIRRSQHDKRSFLKRCELTGGKILDVGCGAGFFLRSLDGQYWQRYGVEISAVASFAASGYLGAGRIFQGSLVEADIAATDFDVITFWSSLEHTNRPRANLIEARRIVKPGGSLIVQVPNAASYQARWFKGDWFALDAPRHRYHFSPLTLGKLLRDTGFEPYLFTLHSRSHNSHSLRQSLKSALRTVTPLLGYGLLCLAVPFIKPFNAMMESIDQGATLTLAARAV